MSYALHKILYVSQRYFWSSGGKGEIRIPETLTRPLVFETSAFNHSATSPRGKAYSVDLRGSTPAIYAASIRPFALLIVSQMGFLG